MGIGKHTSRKTGKHLLFGSLFYKIRRKRIFKKRAAQIALLPKRAKKTTRKKITPEVVIPVRIRSYWKMYKYRKNIKLCEICGQSPPVCTHHIDLFSTGGLEDSDNYQALCKNCHTECHPEIKGFMEANNYKWRFLNSN